MVTFVFTLIGALVVSFSLFVGMAYVAGRLGAQAALDFARYVFTIARMAVSVRYTTEVLEGQRMTGRMEVADRLASMSRQRSRKFLADLRKAGRNE